MKCKRAQEEISGSLVSGESEIGRELGQHLQDCAACGAFFADQVALFQALDSHLRAIANEPVPSSLLPGVRVRLQEVLPPRQGTRTWQLATMGALVVLSAAAIMPLRRLVTPAYTTGSTPAVAYSENSAKHSRPALGRAPLPQPLPRQVTRKAGVATTSSTAEVLVLREEQEAYVHFVNELSKDRDAAVALPLAAPVSGDVPVEIALLAIKSVEVKPLEGTDSE